MCHERKQRVGRCPECEGDVQVAIQKRTPIRNVVIDGLLLLITLCVAALLASYAGVGEEKINLMGMLSVPVGLIWLLAGRYRADSEGFYCRACGYSE